MNRQFSRVNSRKCSKLKPTRLATTTSSGASSSIEDDKLDRLVTRHEHESLISCSTSASSTATSESSADDHDDSHSATTTTCSSSTATTTTTTRGSSSSSASSASSLSSWRSWKARRRVARKSSFSSATSTSSSSARSTESSTSGGSTTSSSCLLAPRAPNGRPPDYVKPSKSRSRSSSSSASCCSNSGGRGGLISDDNKTSRDDGKHSACQHMSGARRKKAPNDLVASGRAAGRVALSGGTCRHRGSRQRLVKLDECATKMAAAHQALQLHANEQQHKQQQQQHRRRATGTGEIGFSSSSAGAEIGRKIKLERRRGGEEAEQERDLKQYEKRAKSRANFREKSGECNCKSRLLVLTKEHDNANQLENNNLDHGDELTPGSRPEVRAKTGQQTAGDGHRRRRRRRRRLARKCLFASTTKSIDTICCPSDSRESKPSAVAAAAATTTTNCDYYYSMGPSKRTNWPAQQQTTTTSGRKKHRRRQDNRGRRAAESIKCPNCNFDVGEQVAHCYNNDNCPARSGGMTAGDRQFSTRLVCEGKVEQTTTTTNDLINIGRSIVIASDGAPRARGRQTEVESSCSSNQTARPKRQSSNLLDPLDSGYWSRLQPHGQQTDTLNADGGTYPTSARAHSFTEATLLNDSNSLVAQLVAASGGVRSRSLCSPSDENRQKLLNKNLEQINKSTNSSDRSGAQVFLFRQANRLVVKKVENFSRFFGKITRSAIDKIHRASISATNLNNHSDLAANEQPARRRNNTIRRFNSQRIRRPKGRFRQTTGKQGKAGDGSEVEIIPHQLDLWHSTFHNSAKSLNTERQPPSTMDDDDELDLPVYAAGGVYVGPGGDFSWNSRAKSISNDISRQSVSATTSLGKRGAISWRPFGAPRDGSTQAPPPSTQQQSNPARDNSCANAKVSRSNGRKNVSAHLQTTAGDADHHHQQTVNISIDSLAEADQSAAASGRHFRQHQPQPISRSSINGKHQDENTRSRQQIEKNLSPLFKNPIGQQATRQRSCSSFEPISSFCSGLNQRQLITVCNSLSYADSGGSSSNNSNNPRSTNLRLADSSSLLKENRSSSFSGLFQYHNQPEASKRGRPPTSNSATPVGGHELVHVNSKSTMELTSNQIAERTSLFVAQLNDRYSNSSHELSPPPTKTTSAASQGNAAADTTTVWFRRASQQPIADLSAAAAASTSEQQPKSVVLGSDRNNDFSSNSNEANSNNKTASQNEQIEFYGANLQTTCIHCQLIAELSNHPKSSYLNQLLVGPVNTTTSSAEDEDDADAGEEENDEQQQQQAEGVRIHLKQIKDVKQVKPSLILTACSNQGTMDEGDEQYDEESLCHRIGDEETTARKEVDPEDDLLQDSSATSSSNNQSAGKLQHKKCEHKSKPGRSERRFSDQSSEHQQREISGPSGDEDDDEEDENINSSRKLSSSSSSSSGGTSSSSSTSGDSQTDEDEANSSSTSAANLNHRHHHSCDTLSSGDNCYLIEQLNEPNDEGGAEATEQQQATPPRRRCRQARRRRKSKGGDQPAASRRRGKKNKTNKDQPNASVQMNQLEVPLAAKARSASLDAPYLLKTTGGNHHHTGGLQANSNNSSSSCYLTVDDYDGGSNLSLARTGHRDDDAKSASRENMSEQQQQQAQDENTSMTTMNNLCPPKSSRSRSVDISLPIRPGESYAVVSRQPNSNNNAGDVAVQTRQQQQIGAGELAADGPSSQRKQRASKFHQNKFSYDDGELSTVGRPKKFIQGEIKVPCANGETRALKSFVNWEDDCINGEHLWVYMGSSSEACYVGESECLKHGPRLCCSACKITAHTSCISILMDKIKFICKHTFKDLTITNPRQLRELQQQNVIYHHWVHKRTHCGRCKQCTKTIGNTKLPFSSKEIQAITCSWCKVSYHNKENCYTLSTLTEPCTLGAHRESIIPPSWILKLPATTNSTTTNNTNQAIQSQESHDQQLVARQGNLIELNATQLFQSKTSSENNIREDSETLVIEQQYGERLNRANCPNKQQKHSSNTTLTTDTSGYMSADCSNNTQNYLASNNNVHHSTDNNRILCDNQEKCKSVSNNNMQDVAFSEIPASNFGEVLLDPSALHAVDLSIINQTQGHNPKDIQQQIILDNDLRTTTLRLNPDQQSINMSHKTHDDVVMTLADAHQQQHQHQIQTRQPRSNICSGFKIVPRPIPGVPSAGTKPVLVFVNPRSGGNQGVKMMQKFNWLLNPRQVFDLIQSGGPRAALELYRDVPNLRILTIGGDGTASWILSHLDDIGMSNRIPVAVLPLGTGNDLARALGWGGGYADEPIAKVLTQVRDGEIVQLDRWNLHIERNYEVTPSSPSEFSSAGSGANMEFSSPPSITSSPSYFSNTASTMSIVDQTNNCDTSTTLSGANTTNMSTVFDEPGNDRLPMDVINNYFSFGVDAHIALEFHTAREAHPERFNSRLRNKMFYGQAGGKDLLKRKWKDLSNFVTLYCDGQDMTSRLKELKVHSVLFLNIPSYGSGTRPWPTTATAFAKPRTDDGLIEVIGLTTYQLPLLQAGGHGTCIAQCRNAKIITSRTIPMQVDGEPCKLLPSIISISFKNRVCMLAKSKSSGHPQKFN